MLLPDIFQRNLSDGKTTIRRAGVASSCCSSRLREMRSLTGAVLLSAHGSPLW